ncbi:MAG: hypothetical protein ACFWUC_02655 [Oscillospiraceae bacterium]
MNKVPTSFLGMWGLCSKGFLSNMLCFLFLSYDTTKQICRFVKHIGQYGIVKIQKEITSEEDASAYC